MNSASGIDETYVLFVLDGTTYGIRSSEVRQLEMIEHITPVPNASSAVEGIVFSRGEVIPVISLRRRFGIPPVEYDLRSRLIVVEVEDRKIGLTVDSAREFKRIADDSIRPPSEMMTGISGDYIEGIATFEDKLILILKLSELVKTETVETAKEG